MKKLMLIMLGCMLLFSCDNKKENADNTIKWIETSKKPIVSYDNIFINIFSGGRKYTLIDANGKVFETDVVDLNLPDTIK